MLSVPDQAPTAPLLPSPRLQNESKIDSLITDLQNVWDKRVKYYKETKVFIVSDKIQIAKNEKAALDAVYDEIREISVNTVENNKLQTVLKITFNALRFYTNLHFAEPGFAELYEHCSADPADEGEWKQYLFPLILSIRQDLKSILSVTLKVKNLAGDVVLIHKLSVNYDVRPFRRPLLRHYFDDILDKWVDEYNQKREVVISEKLIASATVSNVLSYVGVRGPGSAPFMRSSEGTRKCFLLIHPSSGLCFCDRQRTIFSLADRDPSSTTPNTTAEIVGDRVARLHRRAVGGRGGAWDGIAELDCSDKEDTLQTANAINEALRIWHDRESDEIRSEMRKRHPEYTEGIQKFIENHDPVRCVLDMDCDDEDEDAWNLAGNEDGFMCEGEIEMMKRNVKPLDPTTMHVLEAIVVAFGDKYRSHNDITDSGQNGDKKEVELVVRAVLEFKGNYLGVGNQL